MIIDGVFKMNNEQVEEYQAELRKCMYSDENGGLIYFIFEIFSTLLKITFTCRSRYNNVFRSRWKWSISKITIKVIVPLGTVGFHYRTAIDCWFAAYK